MAFPSQGSNLSMAGFDFRSLAAHSKTEPVTAQAFNCNELRYFSINFGLRSGFSAAFFPIQVLSNRAIRPERSEALRVAHEALCSEPMAAKTVLKRSHTGKFREKPVEK